MNNPNSFLELLLIFGGITLVVSVGWVLLATGFEKGKEYIVDSQKSNAEIFSSKEISSIDDFLRNSFGSPGETARVLTKNYYSLFFDDKIKSVGNLYELLQHRNSALTIQGIGLSDEILSKIAQSFHNRISQAIFALLIYENSFAENEYFDKPKIKTTFKIIAEEYNRIAPSRFAEPTEYQDYIYESIRITFWKYDITLKKIFY